MALRQDDVSKPLEGDENINLGGKDLRSRVSTFLNVLIFFTIVLGLIALIASLIMSSIVYDKHKDNLGDEKNLAFWTPITCGIGFLLLLIFIIIFYYRFNPKLEAEDRFLTNMSRVATEPASVDEIRSSFGDYLNSALKTDHFGKEDVQRFGSMLASGGGKNVRDLGENAPKYFRERLPENRQKFVPINVPVRENRRGGGLRYYNPAYGFDPRNLETRM